MLIPDSKDNVEKRKVSGVHKSIDTNLASDALDRELSIGKYGSIDQDKIRKRLPEIRKILFDDNVEIFFIPSTNLRNLVAKGQHPLLVGMPDAFKAIILEGKGMLMQKLMVYKWLTGSLDEKNAFVLSNGELRILNDNITFINPDKDSR